MALMAGSLGLFVAYFLAVMLMLIDVSIMPNRVLAASSQCHIEDSDSECALCWVTSSSDGQVSGPSPCPPRVSLRWLDPPPKHMTDSSSPDGQYTVRYELSLRGEHLRDLSRQPLHAGETTVWDVPHANAHSCFAAAGACTPFVADTPGTAFSRCLLSC
jgi:hypothetical protein